MEENKYTKKIINLCARKAGLEIDEFDMDELIMGMDVELEHGSESAETNVTNDDPVETLKIVIAHMKESDTYYTDLKKVEGESDTEDDTVNDTVNDTEEKENMEESAFAKRMKQLIGESEDESKKQLMNEHWVAPAGPKRGELKLHPYQKQILKEVDESKFDIVTFKKTPIEDKEGEDGSTKELYQLNEGNEIIDLDFLKD